MFSDRTVRGVSVTQPVDTDHLMDHFTPERGFGYEDNRLRIPRVPLNRGEHYKLLVLLSGGDVGRPIRMTGGIRDGEVHPNRSATPDEIPPVLSPAARVLTGLLTVFVLVLATIVVARDDTPPPLGCETGRLTVTGSTAFAPVIRTLAKEYEKDCEGADITVEARGSEAGVAQLAATGARSAKEARSVIAFSDGPMGDRLGLHGERIALSVFTLVVNDGIDLGARGLTRAEVQRLYRGEVRRWSDLNASRPAGLPRLPGLPVVLVSRDAYSGTRQIFQERVLAGAWEMTPTTSLDCDPLKDRAVAASARPAVTRCELASTEDVLDKVAAQPGALGYSELTLATGHEGVRRVPLDGEAASVGHLGRYPYRGVEYAYTHRSPAPGSLAASFLAYLDEGTSQDVIREQGHLPCGRAAAPCD